MPDPPARLAQPRSPTENVVISMQAFAGPLPSPDILQSYENAFPGSAERIISMAEAQSDHRRAMERMAAQTSVEKMRLDYREGKRGQYCAVTVALTFIVAGVVVAKIGQPWAGAILSAGGVCLQALVSTFVRGRQATPQKPDSQDRVNKRSKK